MYTYIYAQNKHDLTSSPSCMYTGTEECLSEKHWTTDLHANLLQLNGVLAVIPPSTAASRCCLYIHTCGTQISAWLWWYYFI